MDRLDADVIVVGAGLAGLVAANEVADAGRSVLLLDQEGEQSLGGQAFWSLGGLFFVNSPEQRRLGIRDSHDLALSDWMTTAGFDRDEDRWPRRWAEAYVDFASGEKRSWLRAMGMRWFPIVGWAERRVRGTSGNSVPRFHITWGTGPGVLAPFERRARDHAAGGRLLFHFGHRVRELVVSAGRVTGVHGEVLETSSTSRGQASSMRVVREFTLSAGAVILTSGGIGGNHDLVRKYWPVDRLGKPPEFMLSGVPEHVDGLMQESARTSGARLINADRMWHYTEGIHNWSPIWAAHGIRILPGPSSLWLSPRGERLPFPHIPGVDTLGTLRLITTSGWPYTWFVLNRAIIKKEFALSGSEQNPDLTGRSIMATLKRVGRSVQPPVQSFMDRGSDFVVRRSLEELIDGMQSLASQSGGPSVDGRAVERAVRDRDAHLETGDDRDEQLAVIRNARRLLSERLVRVAKLRPMLTESDGPFIAVRLNVLTRKSLGGLETDLHGRVIGNGDKPIEGLYAAGEVAGFGGGGMHGYRALEGTFLGGCLFSGRIAGRSSSLI